MTRATPASIAYVATQVSSFLFARFLQKTKFTLKVRFALTSSPVFSRTDTTTDSETFYQSLLELLDDGDEAFEVDELMVWWNRYVL